MISFLVSFFSLIFRIFYSFAGQNGCSLFSIENSRSCSLALEALQNHQSEHCQRFVIFAIFFLQIISLPCQQFRYELRVLKRLIAS